MRSRRVTSSPAPPPRSSRIYCAWRVRGRLGALVGGLAFIVPGLILILALAALFLSGSPPLWVRGLGAGAGLAVAAVAVNAGASLIPASWRRAAAANRLRWLLYVAAGGISAATLGPWLVLVLLACGAIELAAQRPARRAIGLPSITPVPFFALVLVGGGGLVSLAWVAFKVGALSYGGGFVIIPLMQSEAVTHYHWMTAAEFLNAVALGQITPGPVVQTVSVVGYAAAGVGGGLLAAAFAFSPSFAFILFGGERFDRLRRDPAARSFLDGAGPAAIGAILGSSIALARALSEPWQFGLLAGAAVVLFVLRRGVVLTLLLAALIGAIAALAGAPLPH